MVAGDHPAVVSEEREHMLGVVLLGEELQSSIRNARVLLLLWSKAAAESTASVPDTQASLAERTIDRWWREQRCHRLPFATAAR